jgi:hypothetical protein
MRPVLATALLASLLLASSSTRAQESPPPVAVSPPRWSHRGQGTLRASISEGYRFAIRYEDGPTTADPCDDGNNKFCTGLSPLMLDVALGVGATHSLEFEARMRLGLLTDFDGSRPLQFGAGIRTVSDPESPFKFVLGAAIFADVTADRRRAGGDFDVVLRAEEGVQYDVNRWFGVYGVAGESFGLLRNFSCIVDLNLGVQFRAPP